jgi:hypothetical protein
MKATCRLPSGPLEFGHKITWDEFVNSTLADTPILSAAGVEALPTPLATATAGP